jgi:hypothetical protein
MIASVIIATAIFLAQLVSSPQIVILQVVDASQVPVTSPVRGKLLIEACADTTGSPKIDTIPCFLGLLDDKRLIRIADYSIDAHGFERSLCGYELSWSPDGTQFLCARDFSYATGAFFVVFDANGQKKFSAEYFAHWSPDGKYLSVTACMGPHIEPATTQAVYDAYSWELICAVSSGSRMACWNTASECNIPLADGSIWWIKSKSDDPGDDLGFDSFICNQKTGCSPQATLAERQKQRNVPDHTEVSIVNGEIRILYTETGFEKRYIVPESRVVNFAWSPN